MTGGQPDDGFVETRTIIEEDGTVRVASEDEGPWPTSPCSEPIEEGFWDDEDEADEDGPTDIAILCETCFDNGGWDDMWPGGDHHDDPTWGVGTVEAGNEDWSVTWFVRGLTVAQAHETRPGGAAAWHAPIGLTVRARSRVRSGQFAV